MQVLLIEDNEDDVSIIRARLTEKRDTAIRLERTDRLSDGLSRLENGTIDLVLLDLSLPDSQGLDTFSRIHACVPDVPIVVVTALDDEATAAQLMRMGAQDYLVKARLNSDVLLRAIRHAIRVDRWIHGDAVIIEGDPLDPVVRVIHERIVEPNGKPRR